MPKQFRLCERVCLSLPGKGGGPFSAPQRWEREEDQLLREMKGWKKRRGLNLSLQNSDGSDSEFTSPSSPPPLLAFSCTFSRLFRVTLILERRSSVMAAFVRVNRPGFAFLTHVCVCVCEDHQSSVDAWPTALHRSSAHTQFDLLSQTCPASPPGSTRRTAT